MVAKPYIFSLDSLFYDPTQRVTEGCGNPLQVLGIPRGMAANFRGLMYEKDVRYARSSKKDST
jgi:hypothetical protein